MKWAIAWTGFPHYARALVDALAVHIGAPEFVLVVNAHYATKPVPLRCGVTPTEVQPGQRPAVPDNVPDVFLFSGWSQASFIEIARAVHRAGGRNVCMGDNIRNGTVRQWVGRLVYRAWYSRFIGDVLVPGTMSRRFFEYLGQPKERIHCGMYTVDDTVFRAHWESHDRDIDVLYVGQFIPRKGIDTLAKALTGMSTVQRAVFAGGSRTDLWFDTPYSVEVLPFSTTEELSRLMRRSKVFVLPSVVDHWGVVVLEAARSGCLLVVSDHVGARADLIGRTNGIVFRVGDHRALEMAITRLLTSGAREEDEGRAESIRLADQFGVRAGAELIAGILRGTRLHEEAKSKANGPDSESSERSA